MRMRSIGPQVIAAEFADGSVYQYTTGAANTEAIVRMHETARNGHEG